MFELIDLLISFVHVVEPSDCSVLNYFFLVDSLAIDQHCVVDRVELLIILFASLVVPEKKERP